MNSGYVVMWNWNIVAFDWWLWIVRFKRLLKAHFCLIESAALSDFCLVSCAVCKFSYLLTYCVLQASSLWRTCYSSSTVLHTSRQWQQSLFTSPTRQRATCQCRELTPVRQNSSCPPFIGPIVTFAPPWRLHSNSVARVSELRSTLQTTIGQRRES